MAIDQRTLDKTYTGKLVSIAAGCSTETISNYINKNALFLVSEAPGRGKSRRFPLIDVMQFALMVSLVELTGDAMASSKICELQLKQGERVEVPLFSSTRNSETGALQIQANPTASFFRKPDYADYQTAPRAYREFDQTRPWLLFFELVSKGEPQYVRAVRLGEESVAGALDSQQGYFVNVTRTLSLALKRLEVADGETT